MTPAALHDRAEDFAAFYELGRIHDADCCAHEIAEALGCYGRGRDCMEFIDFCEAEEEFRRRSLAGRVVGWLRGLV